MHARTATRSRTPGTTTRTGQPVTANGPARDEDLQDACEADAELLAALDQTGWPLHTSERRDFYHRIRAFPAEVLPPPPKASGKPRTRSRIYGSIGQRDGTSARKRSNSRGRHFKRFSVVTT